MKEGSSVSEEQVPALPSGDIPNSWGFHLLKELRHLEDKIDARFVMLEDKMDARFVTVEDKIDARFVTLEDKMDARFVTVENKMDARFVALEDKVDARFVAQDTKLAALEEKMDARFVAQDARSDATTAGLRQEISALRYWAWASIVAVFVGTVTVILTLKP